jgi:hypothetical protein
MRAQGGGGCMAGALWLRYSGLVFWFCLGFVLIVCSRFVFPLF